MLSDVIHPFRVSALGGDTVAQVPHAVAVAVLGHHPTTVAGLGHDPTTVAGLAGDEWFDAVDLAVRDDAGEVVILGFRTSDYVRVALAGGDPPWRRGAPGDHGLDPGDHRPLSIDLDPSAVRHWDFGRVLWIGPAEHACLVWSNAEALSVRGVLAILGPDPAPVRVGRLLAGPDGEGLPRPADVGIELPADLRWVDYSP